MLPVPDVLEPKPHRAQMHRSLEPICKNASHPWHASPRLQECCAGHERWLRSRATGRGLVCVVNALDRFAQLR